MASGETVLVTGAGGFIGSHLVEALVRAGAARAGLRALQRPRRRRAAPLPPRRDAERRRGRLRGPPGRERGAGRRARGRRPLPPRRPHRHPLLLRAPPRDGGHERDRHPERALRGAASAGCGGSFTPRRARCTAPRAPCPSRRRTRCRASRPTRRARSGRTCWRRASTAPSACPWSRSAPSTPTARASRCARSSPRSPSRRCGATSSASARSPRPATSTSSRTPWTGSCGRASAPGVEGRLMNLGPRRGDDDRRPRREDRRHRRAPGPDRDGRLAPAPGEQARSCACGATAPLARELPRLVAGGALSTRACAAPWPGSGSTSTPTPATGTRCSR